jgi:hypothetical protein
LFAAAKAFRGGSTMAEPEEIVEEVFENQRYIPIEGFSGNYLLPGERPTWSDSTGAPVAVCHWSDHVL